MSDVHTIMRILTMTLTTVGLWKIKYKIQNMIDAKEIEFDPLETHKVITVLMPKHEKRIKLLMMFFMLLL